MSRALRKSTSARRPSTTPVVAVRCLVPAGVTPATLVDWVSAARRRLPTRHGTISVVIVSPREMAKLNNEWRQKSYATNVLSFQLSSGRERNNPEQAWGEIVLCPSVIRKEAKAQSRPYRTYLQFLLAHGLIHLFGLDHHTPAEEKAWARYERRLQL